jgi:uncharacterized membrane protein HdeD (DUF308 family)
MHWSHPTGSTIMQYELRLHRLLLRMLTVILTGVVLLFVYINSHPADIWMEASVSLVVVIVVATALGYMGMAEGIVALQFGMKHKREFFAYLILGLLSLGSGLYLALSETASLGTIALVVSPHAFLFGIAELRLAQHLRHHSKQRRALLLFGICEIAFGMSLIMGFEMSTDRLAGLLAYGAAITTLQLLGFLFYKYQRSES